MTVPLLGTLSLTSFQNPWFFSFLLVALGLAALYLRVQLVRRKRMLRFADELTPGINLGLIAYAGTATLLVSPTTNRDATKIAIDKLQVADSTATGAAIFAALDAISAVGAVIGGGDAPPPARMVLMSDGKETVPTSPDNPKGAFTAARTARDQGVPVSTVSFGTKHGYVDLNGQRLPVPVDDETLTKIAELSGGRSATASSLEQLHPASSSSRTCSPTSSSK